MSKVVAAQLLMRHLDTQLGRVVGSQFPKISQLLVSALIAAIEPLVWPGMTRERPTRPSKLDTFSKFRLPFWSYLKR